MPKPQKDGIYSDSNPKTKVEWALPLDPSLLTLIGYTGDLDSQPTVYFDQGHFTQTHKDEWNIGWDSYDGWECMFFGNIEPEVVGNNKHGHNVYMHSSHDIYGNFRKWQEYAQALTKLKGANRYRGTNTKGVRQFNLHDLGEQTSKRLFELWIRNNGDSEDTRFAHLSKHGLFKPVPLSDKPKRDTLLLGLPKPETLKFLQRVNRNGVYMLHRTALEVI